MTEDVAKEAANLVNRLNELEEIGKSINYIVSSKSVNQETSQRLGSHAMRLHELAVRITKQELAKL